MMAIPDTMPAAYQKWLQAILVASSYTDPRFDEFRRAMGEIIALEELFPLQVYIDAQLVEEAPGGHFHQMAEAKDPGVIDAWLWAAEGENFLGYNDVCRLLDAKEKARYAIR